MMPAPKGKHMAGIIPLSGKENVLKMPWPDYLQPIAEDSTPIERSVHECTLAGCDSIWIVCNDDFAPLVKTRIGDYVLNPEIYEKWHFLRKKADYKKYIPIFYTPISQKDRDRRDSLGWSILHGALTAFTISNTISSWVRPTKYFVSFPWGLYDPSSLVKYSTKIRGKESFFVSYGGKTVRDNEYLAFTFNPEDWVEYKRRIKNDCTGGSRELPLKERWSSRFFTLDKIFNHDKIRIDHIFEIDSYFAINSWSNLKEYYRSDMVLSRPSKTIIKPYIFNRKK